MKIDLKKQSKGSDEVTVVDDPGKMIYDIIKAF